MDLPKHTKIGLVLILCLSTICVLPGYAGKRWYIKENCEFIPNKSNDGDSFHVRVKSKTYIYRLYWVDTPESDDDFDERVEEQADYFGISPAEAVKIGKQATTFTAKFLEKGFTAYTKYQDARGMSRKPRDYVMVETDEGDLGVELVRNGLARIHGFGAAHPDHTSMSTMSMRLKTAEAEAKRNKAGAWALSQEDDTLSIEEQTVTLIKSVSLLAPDNPSRRLGVVKTGADVRVTGLKSPTLVRVIFTTSSGKEIEGLMQRADLGI